MMISQSRLNQVNLRTKARFDRRKVVLELGEISLERAFDEAKLCSNGLLGRFLHLGVEGDQCVSKRFSEGDKFTLHLGLDTGESIDGGQVFGFHLVRQILFTAAVSEVGCLIAYLLSAVPCGLLLLQLHILGKEESRTSPRLLFLEVLGLSSEEIVSGL